MLSPNANNIYELIKSGKKEYSYKSLNYDKEVYDEIKKNKICEYLDELIKNGYIKSYDKVEYKNKANRIVEVRFVIKEVL